jgi:hypothetical protein
MDREAGLQGPALQHSLTIMEVGFSKDRRASGTERLQPKAKRIPLDDYKTEWDPVVGQTDPR